MKRELFYAILFVVLVVVFVYVLNLKMDRIERNRDYIQQFGIEAYVYRTAVRAVIFIVILMVISELLYMKRG